ncbi:unnamed protein product [Linum tenue]|uniref:Uncharacterized protein n=1 Tax=Linum tenue TaxID=586396 RepID=A0AAV0PPP8_9ROSI|nr:unnamed protein product [Linum tenue]
MRLRLQVRHQLQRCTWWQMQDVSGCELRRDDRRGCRGGGPRSGAGEGQLRERGGVRGERRVQVRRQVHLRPLHLQMRSKLGAGVSNRSYLRV